jgi:hypothetical protein
MSAALGGFSEETPMSKVLAVISFIDQHGNPVDPGFGGGRPAPGDPGYGIDIHPHPGHGLPGHGHPDQGLPGYGHPGHDLPGRPNRPDNSLPWAPVGKWPPDETDPEWGVGTPRPPHPGYIPVDPAHPGNALPPVHGHPAPPIAGAPPGTIWPPLPSGAPEGKAALLVWLVGVGWRYMVVTIPPVAAQPLPPTPTPK